MIETNILYDFDDLVIKPTVISQIRSRSECDPYTENNMLPLFTAPMDTVVSKDNAEKFINNKITSIIPRGELVDTFSTDSDMWVAYGLEEFKTFFFSNPQFAESPATKMYVLIDVANGHMKDLRDTVGKAKMIFGSKMVLMVGNVANPSTYHELALAGADYVRVGIGNGGGCLTTQQTGVGYPMASLIAECRAIQQLLPREKRAKIVADGGMKKYADIIKALALGADYVMLGSVLNKALESAAETRVELQDGHCSLEEQIEKIKSLQGDFADFLEDWTPEEHVNALLKQGSLFKEYRGMSTKEVQQKWGKAPKTSEGVSRKQKVEYTLAGWTDNFTAYLKSAMSYTGSYTLEEFRKSTLCVVSENAFKRYNK